ncbi:hypothetical protein BH23VER1_BH23VER1_09340 [soil metagenome]
MIVPRSFVALGLVPTLAGASPDVITELAGSLPRRSAAEVAVLARQHLDAPLTEPALERAWWHLALYRWRALDPDAAAAFVDQHDHLQGYPVPSNGTPAPEGGTPEVDKADAPLRTDDESVRAMIDKVLADHSDRGRRINNLRKALDDVIVSDPAAALAQADRLAADPAERNLLWGAIAQHLRTGDPLVAVRHLDQIPAGKNRTDVAVAAAQSWAEEDPGAALAWAGSLPAGPLRDAALAAATSGLAASQPLAVFDLLERNLWRMDYQNSGADQHTAIPGKWGRREQARGGKGSMKAALSAALTHLVAAGNPAEAMARLASIPDALLRRDLVDVTVKAWLESDPVAAAQWLADAPSGLAGDDTLVAKQLTGLSTSGRMAEVTTLFDSIDNLKTMRDAVRGVAAEATKSNADAVIAPLVDWAATLLPDRRLHAEWSIFVGLTKSNPMAAAELINRFDFGNRDRRAWGIAAEAFYRRDPAEAAAYLQQNADSFPELAFSEFTSEWVGWDSHAASQWLVGLPPGSRRDAAIGALVDRLVTDRTTDFESALAWAEEIADSPGRRQSVARVLAAWREADPATAPKP